MTPGGRVARSANRFRTSLAPMTRGARCWRHSPDARDSAAIRITGRSIRPPRPLRGPPRPSAALRVECEASRNGCPWCSTAALLGSHRSSPHTARTHGTHNLDNLGALGHTGDGGPGIPHVDTRATAPSRSRSSPVPRKHLARSGSAIYLQGRRKPPRTARCQKRETAAPSRPNRMAKRTAAHRELEARDSCLTEYFPTSTRPASPESPPLACPTPR